LRILFHVAKDKVFTEKRKLKGITSARYKLHIYLQNYLNIQDTYVLNGAIKVSHTVKTHSKT